MTRSRTLTTPQRIVVLGAGLGGLTAAALLARAGTDKAKLLMVQIFIKDLADFPAMNAAWEAWLPAGCAPPRATVRADMAKPDWRVEMVVTAAL